MNQYARIDFDPDSDWFKAALYIFRANHGQFNTVWGDSDLSGIGFGFLNRTALLDQQDQRQIARTYISAFLETSLHGERGYLPLFEDARAAGDGWLPQTIYINRYDQAGDLIVANFGEDININSATLPGGIIRGHNLAFWREQQMHSKWSDTELSAVYMGWHETSNAVYSINLSETDLALSGDESLIFNLADANQDPASTLPADENDGQAQPPAPRQPIDLTVLLEDTSGQTARLPLSSYQMLQPQIAVELFKLKVFERHSPSEPVLQTYAIPIDHFTAANPAFDPTRLAHIRFFFDRTPRGSIILDSVGFRPAR
jgi:hypothetical protein